MGCIDVDSMKARRETYGCSKTRVSQWEGVRTQKLINNNNNKVGIVGDNWLLSENESMSQFPKTLNLINIDDASSINDWSIVVSSHVLSPSFIYYPPPTFSVLWKSIPLI